MAIAKQNLLWNKHIFQQLLLSAMDSVVFILSWNEQVSTCEHGAYGQTQVSTCEHTHTSIHEHAMNKIHRYAKLKSASVPAESRCNLSECSRSRDLKYHTHTQT